MDLISLFVLNFYKWLNVETSSADVDIIKKRTRKLEVGDLSFPLDIKIWTKLLKAGVIKDEKITTIFEYCQKGNAEDAIKKIVEGSKKWPITVEKCNIQENVCYIFVKRDTTFSRVINKVLEIKDNYGAEDLGLTESVHVSCDDLNGNLNEMNLSELRLLLLYNTVTNLLKFSNCAVPNASNCKHIRLSLKSNQDLKVILCGPVLNSNGTKNLTPAQEYYKKREIDMCLIAQHKYGVRVKMENEWKQFLEKLGDAAVTIELIQSNPCHPTVIDIANYTNGSSKGASFILYNCARLATLFKEFNKKVESNLYPALPGLEDVNFNLLVQPEEWELLFVYVAQFPIMLRNCLKDILNGRINPHFLCASLSGMCSCFSIYYRRVRILTEARSHLFETLHARMYLLKAVQQILHNGLKLLNIEPVTQM